MMGSWVRSIAAVAAAQLVAGNSPQPPPPPPAPTFAPSCNLTAAVVRVMYLQDVSPSMAAEMQWLRVGGALPALDAWLADVFPVAITSVVSFSNKRIVTGHAGDRCAEEEAPLAFGSSKATYDALSTDEASDSPAGSQLDALLAAAEADWSQPLDMGGKLVVLFSDSTPAEGSIADLPAYEAGADCEAVAYPPVELVFQRLTEVDAAVVLVVEESSVAVYEAMLERAGRPPRVEVVSFGLAPAELEENLFRGVDAVLCPATATDEPTEAPGADSTEEDGIITNNLTPEIITLPPPPGSCEESALLQLLHLQDVSHSYGDSLDQLRAKMPQLVADLQATYAASAFALGTFSDKDFDGVGYWVDYCYREDLPFTTDADAFDEKLASAKILSGWDWREAQLDAMVAGVTSQSVGWYRQDTVLGRKVLRVLLLATDAGAHRQGDLGDSLPAHSPAGCMEQDYPSVEDVAAALRDGDVYPIVIATDDVFTSWTTLMADLSPVGSVVRLTDAIDEVLAAIEAAVEDACSENMRRLAALQAQHGEV